MGKEENGKSKQGYGQGRNGSKKCAQVEGGGTGSSFLPLSEAGPHIW